MNKADLINFIRRLKPWRGLIIGFLCFGYLRLTVTKPASHLENIVGAVVMLIGVAAMILYFYDRWWEKWWKKDKKKTRITLIVAGAVFIYFVVLQIFYLLNANKQ
ncbi:MAG: hypothetical protein M1438_14525 [Deltaproteobacteria bacterium]|nr:hypothetical protein [Deltaproteobacteria bacterium]